MMMTGTQTATVRTVASFSTPRTDLRLAILCAACLLAGPAAAYAQYEILHAFPAQTAQSSAPLLEGSDGDLYGVTRQGGAHGLGVVFALHPTAAGATYRVVHEFAREDGGGPTTNGLIEVAGELYGTTPLNGAYGLGTIYKITAAEEFEVLHAFSGPDGQLPAAELVYTDGAFYGTTGSGGSEHAGTIFKLVGGIFTTLHSFQGEDGSSPRTGLVQGADGALYGTTVGGGPGGGGTVFRITTAGAFTTLRAFDQSREGFAPTSLVRGDDNNFYSTLPTLHVGPDGGKQGPLFFRISGTGTLTWLLRGDPGISGWSDSDDVKLRKGPDGNFYGTFVQGGVNDLAAKGTAFRFTPNGVLTVLHRFTSFEGASKSGIVRAADGFLYGVTFDGGVARRGVLFRLNAAGSFTHLHHFTGLEGENPWAAPVLGPGGVLYGTTVNGGVLNFGTIYRLTSDGAHEALHVFTGADGAYPVGGLVLASDGSFYGTARYGGCAGQGTIYRIDPAGAFSVLHCFVKSEGAQPFAPLIQGTDGALYGTTVQGGTFFQGTIFRITMAGAFTTLQSLQSAGDFSIPGGSSCTGAAFPFAPLVEVSEGLFFGTAANGFSVQFCGSAVFAVTTTGEFAVVHRFFLTGPALLGGLTKRDDGLLYGIKVDAELFRVTPGVLTGTVEMLGNVGSFGAILALNPPVQMTDGTMIGTGFGNPDIIYQRDAAGTITTLKTLTDADGRVPIGLTASPDGALYGSSLVGGPRQGGVVFKYRPE
jgi:uncharacterized repeat protein (TIGR03803 family)